MHRSGLILLGIGVVIFLMALSVHDKQLTIENGNAIVVNLEIVTTPTEKV